MAENGVAAALDLTRQLADAAHETRKI
jgi:hypothetical protein